MSNNTNSTFSFVNALTPKGSKSAQAQEVAINAKIDLQTKITLIDGEIQRAEAMRKINSSKVQRTASTNFKNALGDLRNFDIDAVIDGFKTYKNQSSVDADATLEIAELNKEKALLVEVLAMFPEDTDSIQVEEVKA